MNKNSGFSLIELAVVLIIASLIIVAVSYGNSLYQESILRSVITDMKRFEIYYNNFKNRYKLPPGDFTEADAVWGATCGYMVTCDGNGDGIVNSDNSSANETLRAWKHLELAGILNYQVPMITGSWVGHLSLADVPLGKVKNSGYFIAGGVISQDTGTVNSPFLTENKNAVFLGRESAISTLNNGVLSGVEVFNLDKKFDNARVNSAGEATGAASGLIRAMPGYGSGGSCASGDIYNTGNNLESCVIAYQLDID